MTTTRRGNIGVTMTNTPQEEAEKLGYEMVEALTKFEEEQTKMTLKEAIALVLEPSEWFIKEAREGTIGQSPRFKKAVSHLRQFIEN
tara:strand:- start:943 stop:1203 length:261 start_codon:yes stop_codon:yes gene_type:complete